MKADGQEWWLGVSYVILMLVAVVGLWFFVFFGFYLDARHKQKNIACNIPGAPLLGPQRLSGYCSPMHPNPSPFSVHSYWVGCCQWESNPQPTFNTPGTPADATSCAAQLVASAGVPGVLKVRLRVRFPLATTHPVWMDGEGWWVGVHWAAVTWHGWDTTPYEWMERGVYARDVT